MAQNRLRAVSLTMKTMPNIIANGKVLLRCPYGEKPLCVTGTSASSGWTIDSRVQITDSSVQENENVQSGDGLHIFFLCAIRFFAQSFDYKQVDAVWTIVLEQLSFMLIIFCPM